MKHLFVPYELALKLKEKGFNESCFGYWKNGSFKSQPIMIFVWEDDMSPVENSHIGNWWGLCAAPLYQQVIDWFREKHNIMIELHWQEGTQDYSFCYGYKAGKWFFPKETSQYYEALNKAVEEALKLIQ